MFDVRELRVRDVMTPCPRTVTAETPIGDAYAALVEAGVSGLPIVDAEGRVQGLFSLSDLAAELAPVLHPASDGDPSALAALKARQVGARIEHLVVVGPDEPLVAACQRMVRGRARKVVVVQGERPVGVVSAVDVARAVAALGLGPVDLPPTDLTVPVVAPAQPAFGASAALRPRLGPVAPPLSVARAPAASRP